MALDYRKTTVRAGRQRGTANLEVLLIFLLIGVAIVGTLVGQIIPAYMQRNVAVRLQTGVDTFTTGLFPLARLDAVGDLVQANNQALFLTLFKLSADLDNLTELNGFCSLLWAGELIEDPNNPPHFIPVTSVIASYSASGPGCCTNNCPPAAVSALLEAGLTIPGERKHEVVAFHPQHPEFGIFGTTAYANPGV